MIILEFKYKSAKKLFYTFKIDEDEDDQHLLDSRD